EEGDLLERIVLLDAIAEGESRVRLVAELDGENDGVGRLGAGGFHALHAVADDLGVHPARLQGLARRASGYRIALDDEHAHGGRDLGPTDRQSQRITGG